jgi:hypothetical protein
MRAILEKISEWWQIIRTYIRREPPLPPLPKPWVVMGGLTEAEEDHLDNQPMDDFDNVLFEGDSYNTKTI